MRPNCRSSGVATADAIVSGLAPGNPAETDTTGYSTCGSGATGSWKNANPPASNNANVSNDVAMGLRMNGAEIFMVSLRAPAQECVHGCRHGIARSVEIGDRTIDRRPAWCRESGLG